MRRVKSGKRGLGLKVSRLLRHLLLFCIGRKLVLRECFYVLITYLLYIWSCPAVDSVGFGCGLEIFGSMSEL